MANSSANRIYEFEDFRLDATHLLLWRNRKEVNLTPKAVETLLALVERHGEVVAKDELMKRIWSDAIVEESNLSQYLYLLRKTLGKRADGNPFIETLKRRGYRFNGEVRVAEPISNGNSANETAGQYKDRGKFEGPPSSENKAVRLQNPKHEKVRGVNQIGNLLVLEEWREKNKENLRKDDVVADQKDEVTPGLDIRANFRIAGLIFVAVLIFSAALALFAMKFATGGNNPAPKRELIITNLTQGESPVSPAISPDGKYFVYHTKDEGKKAQLWLQQVGQANRVEIIPPFAETLSSKTFTPDSKYIYFLAKEDANQPVSLFRVPALGGALKKILTDISTSVSFSPDGRELVFRRVNGETGESSLVIASSEGGNERTLLTRNGASEMVLYAAWSPDGRTIAFGDLKISKSFYAECTIAAIDLQTSEIDKLSKEKWDYCYRMDWTRDGNGLVMVGTRFNEIMSSRRNQIFYISKKTGESERLTAGESRYQPDSLTVTIDDAIIASPYTRPSQIWAIDIDGDSSSAIQISRGQSDGRSGIAPLPDGRIGYMAQAGENNGVWIMDADGANRRQLIENHPTAEELRASPDGRFFIFAAKDEKRGTHLFRIDSDGTTAKQLTFGESRQVDSTVSPDSKWVVYDSATIDGKSSNLSLWKISADGGEPVLLSDINCHAPHFSPDGAFVSCISELNRITVLSSENGSVVKTFDAIDASGLNVGARWMPDGQALIYQAATKGTGNIWKQYIDGGEPEPLTDFTSGSTYNFAVSFDGSKLFVARGYPVNDVVLITNFR